MVSLELVGGISPNLHRYINVMSLRADLNLVTLTPFFQDHMRSNNVEKRLFFTLSPEAMNGF